MKRCALLDMGGVIVRVGSTEGLPQSPLDHRGRQAMLAVLARAGARVSLEQLDALLFRPWRLEHAHRYDLVRDASWEPHLDRLIAAAAVELDRWELLGAWFRPYAERLEAEPGAADALQRLRALGLQLGLVSNVPLPGRFYRPVLERLGLLEPFDALCFSYDHGTRKPSPKLLHRALAELGASPEEALMVGDRRRADVAAGRAAGIETVWVRSAWSDGPEADHEIGSIVELPDLIRS